jgi:hypothetical protein
VCVHIVFCICILYIAHKHMPGGMYIEIIDNYAGVGVGVWVLVLAAWCVAPWAQCSYYAHITEKYEPKKCPLAS